MARVKISAGQLPCPTHPWGSGVVSVGIAQKFVGNILSQVPVWFTIIFWQ